ncbi:MAG: hypothetical protein AB9Q19_01470 [Candidatus Reddybacter sp.]
MSGNVIRPGGGFGGQSVRHWFFNENELMALRELLTLGYPMAALIYQLELRPNMDFKASVVGRKRRISEQGLRELVERRPGRGSRWAIKQRDRRWVQRQISALEKVGLIEKLPGELFCFLLVLANAGQVRANEERADERTDSRLAPKPLSAGKENKKQHLTAVPSIVSGGNVPNVGADERATSEKIFTTTTSPVSFEDLRSIDMAMVVDAYHRVLPGLPKIRAYDSPGYRHLVAGTWFREPVPKHQSPEFWDWYFKQVRDSDFLMGRAFNPRLGKYRANFKSLVGDGMFEKILNGEFS